MLKAGNADEIYNSNDIVDEVDYRNKAANKAWRQAGREYNNMQAQHDQVPPPPTETGRFRESEAAHTSRREHVPEQPQELYVGKEGRRCYQKTPLTRRQTVEDGHRPVTRKETVSLHNGREITHPEGPPGSRHTMKPSRTGNSDGGSSRRTAMQQRDHREPQATELSAQQLSPVHELRKDRSRGTQQSALQELPAGKLPDQLRLSTQREQREKSKHSTQGSRSKHAPISTVDFSRGSGGRDNHNGAVAASLAGHSRSSRDFQHEAVTASLGGHSRSSGRHGGQQDDYHVVEVKPRTSRDQSN